MPCILACTDGSRYAASVYDLAAWAAARLDATVEVLHVLDHHRERGQGDLQGNLGVNSRDELLTELAELDEARAKVAVKRARVVLDQAREHLAAAGVAEPRLTSRHGTLLETLAEFEEHADLVVIGKRGENASVDVDHLGGNLERVVRACGHPVLVAPRQMPAIDRVLIAYDGGPSARRAVEAAAASPLVRGLDIHLAMADADTASNRAALDKARASLEGAGHRVQTHLRLDEAERLIPALIQELGIGLLIMGAYGHSRIRRLIVGSTTTTVIRTTHVPVLMVR